MRSCHIRTIIPIRQRETLRNKNKRKEILLIKSKKEYKKNNFFLFYQLDTKALVTQRHIIDPETVCVDTQIMLHVIYPCQAVGDYIHTN